MQVWNVEGERVRTSCFVVFLVPSRKCWKDERDIQVTKKKRMGQWKTGEPKEKI
jgi:hypothetical protein